MQLRVLRDIAEYYICVYNIKYAAIWILINIVFALIYYISPIDIGIIQYDIKSREATQYLDRFLMYHVNWINDLAVANAEDHIFQKIAKEVYDDINTKYISKWYSVYSIDPFNNRYAFPNIKDIYAKDAYYASVLFDLLYNVFHRRWYYAQRDSLLHKCSKSEYIYKVASEAAPKLGLRSYAAYRLIYALQDKTSISNKLGRVTYAVGAENIISRAAAVLMIVQLNCEAQDALYNIYSNIDNYVLDYINNNYQHIDNLLHDSYYETIVKYKIKIDDIDISEYAKYYGGIKHYTAVSIPTIITIARTANQDSTKHHDKRSKDIIKSELYSYIVNYIKNRIGDMIAQQYHEHMSNAIINKFNSNICDSKYIPSYQINKEIVVEYNRKETQNSLATSIKKIETLDEYGSVERYDHTDWALEVEKAANIYAEERKVAECVYNMGANRQLYRNIYHNIYDIIANINNSTEEGYNFEIADILSRLIDLSPILLEEWNEPRRILDMLLLDDGAYMPAIGLKSPGMSINLFDYRTQGYAAMINEYINHLAYNQPIYYDNTIKYIKNNPYEFKYIFNYARSIGGHKVKTMNEAIKLSYSIAVFRNYRAVKSSILSMVQVLMSIVVMSLAIREIGREKNECVKERDSIETKRSNE